MNLWDQWKGQHQQTYYTYTSTSASGYPDPAYKALQNMMNGGVVVKSSDKFVVLSGGVIVQAFEKEKDALDYGRRLAAKNDGEVFVFKAYKKLATVPKDVEETDI